jgi:hypothetical protein
LIELPSTLAGGKNDRLADTNFAKLEGA